MQQDIAPPIPAVSTERTTDDEPVPIKQWQLKQQKMLTEKGSLTTFLLAPPHCLYRLKCPSLV